MADGFLGRWSRRKQELREGKALQEPSPAVSPTAPPPERAPAAGAESASAGVAPPSQTAQPAGAEAAPPPPTLADAQALTPESDFKPYVARAVSPEVRNLAMKKLFADPHFNVMDGLDIYVGDYTQPDPLPAGMLRKMASAHAMGFFDHEKKGEAPASAQADAAQTGAGAAPETPAATQPREDAHGAPSADVAQSRPHTAISGEPSSEPVPATAPVAGAVATPASQTDHDHDADLRLQPDDAPRREGAGRGAA